MAVTSELAVVGGLILAGLAFWQYTIADDERAQIVTLRHQLSDKRDADLKAARLGCSDRSQRYFNALGYDEAKGGLNSSTTFETHYNERLARCLMTLETTSFTDGHQITGKNLIDTDERKTFGEYSWVSSNTKKYDDQAPIQCRMAPPDRPEAFCRTTDEYNAFEKEMLSN